MYVHVGGAIQVSTLHVHMRGSSWITIFHYKQHFRPTQVDGGHVMRRDDKVLDGTSRGLFQHSPLVVFHILSRNRSYRPQCFLRMYTCAMYRRLLPVYVHLCGQTSALAVKVLMCGQRKAVAVMCTCVEKRELLL